MHSSIKQLGQKNLFYSILLAAVMMLLLVGYFILMLPSLYVSHIQEQNLEAIKKQHQAFVETGSYAGVQVKNPTACVSVKIPFHDSYVEMTTKQITMKITAENAETRELLGEIQDELASADFRKQQKDGESMFSSAAAGKRPDDFLQKKMLRWQEKLEDMLKRVQLPFGVEINRSVSSSELFFRESFRMHVISEQMMIMESGIEDENNRYTNYVAVEEVENGIVFSVLPVVTPEMQEIRPTVMQSLPMLCAVILMLVLLFSQIYSNGIVLPVYHKLQHLNQTLAEENERKEMFLRASSHQLKTPVTAALLLTDGMMNRIGKYQDTKTYLPKVKEQLLSMRSIIDQILSLHLKSEECSVQKIDFYEFASAHLCAYRIAAAEKQLELLLEGDRGQPVYTDSVRLSKILDNLIANAVAYTPQGEKVCIYVEKEGFRIQNEGVTIPQEILAHIFEPFVRGEQEGGTHGLGLYIAAYYAREMGAQLQIRNQGNAVEAVLKLNARDV